ncbi:MAG TPA: ROK family transcriptional regulator [Pyrinomonadaceae bacterium]|jgi:predicted NBD/HSP70 family sugar kinase|nr:ROK family transcriptional regulator [Pyrinomonadaceae bacterium]
MTTRRALINHHAEAGGTTNPARAGRMLLRLLRAAQPISRVELARRLGVNRSTVTDTFKPLIAAGVVLEDAAPVGAARNLGRPPSSLSFNTGRDLFAGVSLGVKRSQVGVATLGGEILAEEEFETPAEAEEALKLVRSSVERLCARVHGGRELRLIGVSVPGPVNAERRCLLYAPHLGWQHVPVAEALDFDAGGRRVHRGEGIPVVVENNATAAALYESRLKLRGRDSGLMSDFVLVRSGTGIGVGLVIGGEVYRGTGKGAGLAGEFGHMTIVAGGKPCPCGNRGCWERYGSAAAASALYAGDRVQLGGAAPPRFVEIVARAEGGELRARRTLERVGEYLGIGIANVLMGLGVPRVIISGRVVHGWKYIKDPLHEAVGQSMAGRLEGWSVEPGQPQGAGLGGALEVAVEGFLDAGLYA